MVILFLLAEAAFNCAYLNEVEVGKMVFAADIAIFCLSLLISFWAKRIEVFERGASLGIGEAPWCHCNRRAYTINL